MSCSILYSSVLQILYPAGKYKLVKVFVLLIEWLMLWNRRCCIILTFSARSKVLAKQIVDEELWPWLAMIFSLSQGALIFLHACLVPP